MLYYSPSSKHTTQDTNQQSKAYRKTGLDSRLSTQSAQLGYLVTNKNQDDHAATIERKSTGYEFRLQGYTGIKGLGRIKQLVPESGIPKYP